MVRWRIFGAAEQPSGLDSLDSLLSSCAASRFILLVRLVRLKGVTNFAAAVNATTGAMAVKQRGSVS